jgi:hypothetical protein
MLYFIMLIFFSLTSSETYLNQTISDHPSKNIFPESYDATFLEFDENIGE